MTDRWAEHSDHGVVYREANTLIDGIAELRSSGARKEHPAELACMRPARAHWALIAVSKDDHRGPE